MFMRPLKLRNGNFSWARVETAEESFNWNANLKTNHNHTFKELRDFIVNFLERDAWKSIVKKFEKEEDKESIITIFEHLLNTDTIKLRHLPYLYLHCSNTELTLDGNRRQYKLHIWNAADVFDTEIYWGNKYTTITLHNNGDGYEIEEANLGRIRALIAEQDETLERVLNRHIRHGYTFANANNVGHHYLILLLTFYLGKQCLVTPVDLVGLVPRGTRINAGTLRQYMKQHPNLKVTFDIKQTRGIWQLNMVIPINYESRSTLYNTFEYNTKVTSFLPYAIRQKEEKKNPLYGIELEVSTDHSIPNLIDAQKRQLFFFCKFDRSITGKMNNNVEIVTVPASLASHRRLWSGFFKELPASKDKWDTSSKTNNGMHVHVSRKAFKDDEHLKRFVWFFAHPSNYDFQYEISERHDKRSLDQYAITPSLDLRTNLTQANNVMKLTNWALMQMTSLGHRGMVNTALKETIEVRLFRGLVSFSTVMKNLEYIDALVNFSKDAQPLDLTVGTFIHYVRQNIQKYPALHMFLENIDTEELIIESNLHTTIGHMLAEPNPEAIMAELQKHGIEQTQALCQHLNRLTREKAFFWNPAHQRIDHFDLNYARLSKHDHVLSEDLLYTADLEMETGAIE